MTVMSIPKCRKHKTGKCMQLFYIGDGVNQPIDLIWLCARTMDSTGFKLMKKNHAIREVREDVVACVRAARRTWKPSMSEEESALHLARVCVQMRDRFWVKKIRMIQKKCVKRSLAWDLLEKVMEDALEVNAE